MHRSLRVVLSSSGCSVRSSWSGQAKGSINNHNVYTHATRASTARFAPGLNNVTDVTGADHGSLQKKRLMMRGKFNGSFGGQLVMRSAPQTDLGYQVTLLQQGLQASPRALWEKVLDPALRRHAVAVPQQKEIQTQIPAETEALATQPGSSAPTATSSSKDIVPSHPSGAHPPQAPSGAQVDVKASIRAFVKDSQAALAGRAPLSLLEAKYLADAQRLFRHEVVQRLHVILENCLACDSVALYPLVQLLALIRATELSLFLMPLGGGSTTTDASTSLFEDEVRPDGSRRCRPVSYTPLRRTNHIADMEALTHAMITATESALSQVLSPNASLLFSDESLAKVAPTSRPRVMDRTTCLVAELGFHLIYPTLVTSGSVPLEATLQKLLHLESANAVDSETSSSDFPRVREVVRSALLAVKDVATL